MQPTLKAAVKMLPRQCLIQARFPGHVRCQASALDVGDAAGKGDSHRQCGSRLDRRSTPRIIVLYVQEGRRGCDPVVRLGHPLARAGDDDHQRVAARPARAVHDLLDDRGEVRRLLVRSRFACRNGSVYPTTGFRANHTASAVVRSDEPFLVNWTVDIKNSFPNSMPALAVGRLAKHSPSKWA